MSPPGTKVSRPARAAPRGDYRVGLPPRLASRAPGVGRTPLWVNSLVWTVALCEDSPGDCGRRTVPGRNAVSRRPAALHTTSLTLLERLRQPGDQEAWTRFVQLYTPLLYHWARRAGLQEQDAAD